MTDDGCPSPGREKHMPRFANARRPWHSGAGRDARGNLRPGGRRRWL